jgi:NAD(P)-dependent dehydrogenase (short-subunit alcohol dehydrogenase family)
MNNDKRVALITGASSDIGRVTAVALKQAGYRVFGTSRKAVSSDVDGITMLICDVTDETSVAATVVQAANAAEPKRRYPAGKQARQVRFLPEYLVDRALRKFNGMPV